MDIIEALTDSFYLVLLISGVWFVTFLFVRYFSKFLREADRRSASFDIDKRTFKTIDRILDTIVIILAIALSLSILGVSSVLYATLTAFGVIGLVIGLAIKDLTSNIFSGLMMLFNPSFLVGDYIEIDNYAGTVEKISLRMTTIRRSDGVLLTMPNTMFITKPIINYSITKKRRIEVTVAIANENDVDKALSFLRKAAESHEHTIQTENIEVVMTDVKDYAVDITLRFWVPRSNLRSSTSFVLKEITNIFKANNVELAVPLRKYV